MNDVLELIVCHAAHDGHSDALDSPGSRSGTSSEEHDNTHQGPQDRWPGHVVGGTETGGGL